MNSILSRGCPWAFLLACFLGGALLAQNQKSATEQPDPRPPAGPGLAGDPNFDQPPPFGPGGFGGGGPGRGGPPGMMQQKTKLVAKFDQDGDGRLNAAERKAARAFLSEDGSARGRFGRPGRFGPGGRGTDASPAQPGSKLSPAEVSSYPDVPLYDPHVLRTIFLEFDDADWEKELAEFKNTDVEVPARLRVDAKTYPEVGVHFRGMSSFMMVGEGRKRSLSLSLDFVNKKQAIGGYNTLHLLNSHEDPTFLRSVLSYQIDREYLPAPKANLVRVVINGESWGIYVNVQHFNKEFLKEWFGTSKGARWKVPGSPGGQGSLAYLGQDPAPYKRIYEIKSKDDPKPWTDLINLCQVLNQTPSDKLEQVLSPILDIDGALRFLALDNALINNDGYWIRTSDYSLYQDIKGQFHLVPQDSNETFSLPEGPGGGRGGPPRRGGGPGFGGRGGFGPGMFLAPQILAQGDKNGDQKLTELEFTNLADTWFTQWDSKRLGQLSEEQFVEQTREMFARGPGGAPPDGFRDEGRRGGAPALGPALFAAADLNKDGSLTRAEWKATFAKWFSQWDSDQAGTLNEVKLRTGLNTALPRPDMAGERGGRGGRGPGGPGLGGRTPVDGVKLDPLIAAADSSKPLISKLLAVPSLRARYLAYVQDIANQWLDWNKLGPMAQDYYTLISADVKSDTRKLASTDDFLQGLMGNPVGDGFGPRTISLKRFADERRAYLLGLPAIQNIKP